MLTIVNVIDAKPIIHPKQNIVGKDRSISFKWKVKLKVR